MPDASQPIASATVRRALEGREPSELFRLREEIENLKVHPGWQAIEQLLTEARESVLETTLRGPTLGGKQLNRQLGYLAGLEEVGQIVDAVEIAANKRESQLHDQAEREAAAEGAQP